MIRTTVTAALLALTCAVAPAQSDEASYQAKLKKPFVKKIPWVLDFNKAKQQAHQDRKLILGYFSRSYAP